MLTYPACVVPPSPCDVQLPLKRCSQLFHFTPPAAAICVCPARLAGACTTLPPAALLRLPSHSSQTLLSSCLVSSPWFLSLVLPDRKGWTLSSLDGYVGVLGCSFILHQAGSTSGQPCCEGNQALLSAPLAQADAFTPAGTCLELGGWPDTSAQNLLEDCFCDIAGSRGARAAGGVQKPPKA